MGFTGNSVGLRSRIGVVVFIAALGIGIRYLFSHVILQLFSLMEVEEYSYIMTAFFVSLVLLGIGLSRAIPASSIRLSHLFTASVFVLTSMVFYVLSKILLFYSLVLSVLSMILFVWSLFIVFYPREELKKLLLPLLSLSLLIPLPREVIDSLSVYLTKVVAILSSMLSGAELVSNPNGRIYLVAMGEAGKVSFEIITACSGIISITSFLALIPLLVYFTRGLSVSRRFKAVLLASIVGLVIVFFGNVFRVVAMVLIAKSYGVSAAYTFFHSAPSYIYSAAASIASIYVLFRLAGRQRNTSIRRVETDNTVAVGSNGYTVIFVFLMFFLIVVAGAVYIQENTSVSLSGFDISRYSYDYVLEHTLNVVLRDDVKIIYERPMPALERALGSSLVKSIAIRYNGSFHTGYVEFAETPARFHGWWVCLTFQGYEVKRVWSEEAESLTITFVEYSRKNTTFLLGYTIFEIPLYFGNQTVDTGYIRLSLFIPVRKNVASAADNFKNILLSIVREDLLQHTERKRELLDTLSTVDMVLVAMATGYYVLVFLSRAVYSLVSNVRGRFSGRR